MAAKKFRNLRIHMLEMDVTQAWLAGKLNCCTSYVSDRFVGKQPWTMDEAYTLCRLLHIPTEQLLKYFPENGKDSMPSLRDEHIRQTECMILHEGRGKIS